MSNLMIYKLKSTIKNRIRVIMNSDGVMVIANGLIFKIVSNNYAVKGLLHQILELHSHSCYIPIYIIIT